MKKLSFILFIVVVTELLPTVQGQNTQDSAKYYVSQARVTLADHPQEAVKLIRKANKFCCDGSKTRQEQLDLIYGNALSALGVRDSAEIYLTRALHAFQAKDDSAKIVETMHSIALNLDYAGKYQEAVQMYYKVVSLAEKCNSLKTMAASYNNIGIIFRLEGNYDKALDIYSRVLQIDESLYDTLGIAQVYNNIGGTYEAMKKFDLAYEHYKKTLMYSEMAHSLYGRALSHGNIGAALYHLNRYDEALENYQKSIELYKEMGYEDGMPFAYIHMAAIYRELGHPQKGLSLLRKAKKIQDELKDTEQKTNLLLEFAETYHALQMEDSAYYYLMEHKSLNDSIHNKESIKQIAEMETKYQSEKKDAAIRLLNKDNLLNEAQLARQNLQIYAFIAVMVLLGIISLVVFSGYRQKKRANEVISIQKQTVEQKNKEILDSITYAKRIQSAILPPLKTVKELLPESFVLYKPKDIVAGDFYWLQKPTPNPSHQEGNKNSAEQVLPDGEDLGGAVLFAACDCTGHGVPGAMVSVVCNNGLNRSVREYGLTDPGKILDKTREIVIREFDKSEEVVKDGMDVALVSLAQRESESGERMLQYAGANNPLWIIRKNGTEVEEIKANKQPIGKFESHQPYTTHEVQLASGDTIYIFSDGFADQFGGEKGKKFKAANFKKLLLSMQHEPMEKQKEHITEAFENWKGSLEQLDDICVIGVRV